jgi:hypothetical protein
MSQLIARSVQEKKAFAKMAAIIHQMSVRTSAGAAHPNPNPHGWKSWRDIPDSMIPTTSKRDPDNPIYGTRTYVDYRKKQIWFQIPDGVPVFLKGGTPDKIAYYGVWIGVTVLLCTNLYYIGLMIFAPDRLKKN